MKCLQCDWLSICLHLLCARIIKHCALCSNNSQEESLDDNHTTRQALVLLVSAERARVRERAALLRFRGIYDRVSRIKYIVRVSTTPSTVSVRLGMGRVPRAQLHNSECVCVSGSGGALKPA